MLSLWSVCWSNNSFCFSSTVTVHISICILYVLPFSSFVPLIECLSVFSPFIFFAFCPLSWSLSVDHKLVSVIARQSAEGGKMRRREKAVTEEDRHEESDSLKNKTNLTAEKRKRHCREKKICAWDRWGKFHLQSENCKTRHTVTLSAAKQRCTD